MNGQFKVVFYLRSGYRTKDGKVPVLVRLYLNNERLILGSAGINVEEKQWDSVKERVKGRKADEIGDNATLDRMEAVLSISSADTNLMTIYRSTLSSRSILARKTKVRSLSWISSDR